MQGQRSAGFTLLELLVVLVLIGIIVSFAALSISGRSLDDRIELEAERLNQLVGLAAEEATLKGYSIGLHVDPQSYGFYRLDESGAWTEYDPQGDLRSRELAEPMYLELWLDGRVAPPPAKDEHTVKPQVLLLSSGESTSFALDVRAQQYAPYYRIEGDALGRIKLTREQPER